MRGTLGVFVKPCLALALLVGGPSSAENEVMQTIVSPSCCALVPPKDVWIHLGPADDAELLDADNRNADSNLHYWDSADDAEQRDDAADDAEPQAESDDAADDARNAEPDGDDSQATPQLMSPVPADDADLN